MLGREIVDTGIEDTVGTIPGLGLLDAVTRFDLYEKRTVQVKTDGYGRRANSREYPGPGGHRL